MESEQYFILAPKQCDGKAEVVVVKNFVAKDFAEALATFEKYLDDSNSINSHFLVNVLGRGQFEIEKKFKFLKSGEGA